MSNSPNWLPNRLPIRSISRPDTLAPPNSAIPMLVATNPNPTASRPKSVLSQMLQTVAKQPAAIKSSSPTLTEATTLSLRQALHINDRVRLVLDRCSVMGSLRQVIAAAIRLSKLKIKKGERQPYVSINHPTIGKTVMPAIE